MKIVTYVVKYGKMDYEECSEHKTLKEARAALERCKTATPHYIVRRCTIVEEKRVK